MSGPALERRCWHTTVGAAAVIAFLCLLAFQAARAGGAASLPGAAPAVVSPQISAPDATRRFTPPALRERRLPRGFAPGDGGRDFAPGGADPRSPGAPQLAPGGSGDLGSGSAS